MVSMTLVFEVRHVMCNPFSETEDYHWQRCAKVTARDSLEVGILS